MRFLFVSIFCFTLFLTGYGQKVCVSAEYAARTNVAYNPLNNSTLFSRDTIANEIITIPVVVHVLYHNNLQNISDAQIRSQIQVLNDDFRRMNADAINTPTEFSGVAADTRIMFCMAQIDQRGRPFSGVVRKYTSKVYFEADDAMKFSAAGGDDAWDSRKYLNIWVCKIGGNVMGYASVPGSQADKDGVVIQYDAFGTTGNINPAYQRGRTATHEIGHWMGLRHLWGDEICGDDGIADTPPQSNYNTGCPTFPHLSACSVNNQGDMYMNYMDYSSEDCMSLFTVGQKNKMRSVFSINGSRNSLINSFVCDSTLAAAPLPTDSTVTSGSSATLTIKVFPNPVHSRFGFLVSSNYQLSGKELIIMNQTGTVVKQLKLISNEDKIDLSTLPAGVYLVSVGQGAERRVAKLIKI